MVCPADPRSARGSATGGSPETYHGLEQAYIGHIVLGKCAMIDGDVDSAEQHLPDRGTRIPGSDCRYCVVA
jgi:hypothetical protein